MSPRAPAIYRRDDVPEFGMSEVSDRLGPPNVVYDAINRYSTVGVSLWVVAGRSPGWPA
jgi:hypothetical protein